MKFRLALSLSALLAASAAFSDDEAPPAPPPRPVVRKPVEPPKFEKGKLTDSYWGITYELPGLEEKKGERQAGNLLDAHVGRVQVEVRVWEYPDQLSAKERRDADRKKWDERHRDLKEYAQGDDPAPWATFQEEAVSGGMRRHAYAWFVRGPRAFVVHAYVMADAEGGADGVKAALAGLRVGPETGAAVLVQVAAKQGGRAWDDANVLFDAAAMYMADQKGAVPLPEIAEGLLLSAAQNLPQSAKPEGVLNLHMSLAGAQMKRKKFDEALATLTKCLELATKTETPGPSGASVMYNTACLYSLQGKLDEAFACLEKAFSRAADWGPPVTDEHLKKDPDLENCRKDQRWFQFMTTKPRKP